MKNIFNKNSGLIWLQKKNRFLAFGFSASLLFSLFACENFVEIEQPSSQLASSGVFNSPSTANAAMVAIYAQLRNATLLTGSPLGLSNQLGHYADELNFYGDTEISTFGFYTNSLLASNSTVAGLWNNSYHVIYNTNAVIEGVTASTTLPDATAQQLRGEALFVRALVHFYLVNIYGAIPYITTTDYKQNRVVTRMPIEKIYELIITDLSLASSLLSSEDSSGERTRPNKYVAQALLARTYLYDGLWSQAANASSAILNNTAVYRLENDLNSVFLNGSSSTIWQFSPGYYGSSTEEGNLFIFTSGPPPFTALSDVLMAAFEPMDMRRAKWTNAVTNGTSTWYHAYKYKDNNSTTFSAEYAVILRLEEQYLIRAEARARTGDLIGAKEDLNVIRNRAGLDPTLAVSQQQILDAILKERRVELFTEHGHRFFDLKRYGKLDEVLGTKVGWNSTDALLPIPETEILVNPNLAPQNTGY
ncbi:RagB/SusD family nutrient uptake outer membrane protein [Flavobacterium acetivorans]|uniref:RagB/SusD family nutrient uptake outer membrane protein n=1 Tax=Flavobacterium acetivorans TaxID=2893883 RepID=UPI001E58E24D|nr:RagB/SusD family nutrient uptake outer membrane protein [Flavobacterium sp. F-29]UFH36533.1 RagB/SusD family nutrient uptake outer membrane protein [Flavobacterium sp. F-29]